MGVSTNPAAVDNFCPLATRCVVPLEDVQPLIALGLQLRT